MPDTLYRCLGASARKRKTSLRTHGKLSHHGLGSLSLSVLDECGLLEAARPDPSSSHDAFALIFVFAYGPWPQWTSWWLEHARRSGFDFVLVTDQAFGCSSWHRLAARGPAERHTVFFWTLPLAHFTARLRKHTGLGWNSTPSVHAIICDSRPLLPLLFDDELRGYKWWGWADMDVLFGNLTSLFNDKSLASTDGVSPGLIHLSFTKASNGAFSLFRNSMKVRSASLAMVARIRQELEAPKHHANNPEASSWKWWPAKCQDEAFASKFTPERRLTFRVVHTEAPCQLRAQGALYHYGNLYHSPASSNSSQQGVWARASHIHCGGGGKTGLQSAIKKQALTNLLFSHCSARNATCFREHWPCRQGEEGLIRRKLCDSRSYS